jgi:hypothetical protein
MDGSNHFFSEKMLLQNVVSGNLTARKMGAIWQRNAKSPPKRAFNSRQLISATTRAICAVPLAF